MKNLSLLLVFLVSLFFYQNLMAGDSLKVDTRFNVHQMFLSFEADDGDLEYEYRSLNSLDLKISNGVFVGLVARYDGGNDNSSRGYGGLKFKVQRETVITGLHASGSIGLVQRWRKNTEKYWFPVVMVELQANLSKDWGLTVGLSHERYDSTKEKLSPTTSVIFGTSFPLFILK